MTNSQLPNFHTIAMEQLRRGFYIIPLIPGGKRPVTSGWTTELTNDDLSVGCSNDQAVIDLWALMEPHANVGVVTGASDLYVVDIDTKNGGFDTWENLVAEHGQPDTYTVRTRSGGLHLYFTPTPGATFTNSASTVYGPGIDVRAVGGQVVAPGSWADGLYTVENDSPIAPMPTWMHLAELKARSHAAKAPTVARSVIDSSAHADTPTVFQRVHQLADELSKAPEGTANNAAFRLATMAGGYVGAGQIQAHEALEILESALNGWTFTGGSRDAMITTLKRGITIGARTPRPWVDLDIQHVEIVSKKKPGGDLGISPGIDTAPTPGHIAQIIEQMTANIEYAHDSNRRQEIVIDVATDLANQGASPEDVATVRRAVKAAGVKYLHFDHSYAQAKRDLKARRRVAKVTRPVREVPTNASTSAHTQAVPEAPTTPAAPTPEPQRPLEYSSVADLPQGFVTSPVCEPGAILPNPNSPMDVAIALAQMYRDRNGTFTLRQWQDVWYNWTGARWEPVPDKEIRKMIYLSTGSATFIDQRGHQQKWSPNQAKVSNVMAALADGVLQLPDSLEPAPGVFCQNGSIDLTTREITKPDPRVFNLAALPFDYDPTATCPAWEKFLSDVLGDEEIKTLRQWFGYVISGDSSQQKMLSLVGPPRSGKGTIGRVLESLLGSYQVASPMLHTLGTPFGAAPLIGKSLAIIGDARWNSRQVVEAVPLLLGISGGDSVDIDRKHMSSWHGHLPVRFMFMSNDEPTFTDAAGALANRMIHLVFNKSFLGNEDTGLTERLMRELPGILNWALDGLDEYLAEGSLYVPARSDDVTKETVHRSSEVTAFVDEICVEDADAVSPLDDLYSAYALWCARNNMRVKAKPQFSRDLNSAFRGRIQIVRTRVGGQRVRLVHGLLVEDDVPQQLPYTAY